MLAAVASMVTNDALLKFAMESMPVSQVMFVRGIFAAAFIVGVGFLMRVSFRLRPLMDRRVGLRSVFDTLAVLTGLFALIRLPLPNLIAITMAAPLFATLMAASLGEKVSA